MQTEAYQKVLAGVGPESTPGLAIRASMAQVVGRKLEEVFANTDMSQFDDLYQRVIADQCEGALLIYVLGRVGGNQVHVAKILGINRNTLRKKMRRHGLLAKPEAPSN